MKKYFSSQSHSHLIRSRDFKILSICDRENFKVYHLAALFTLLLSVDVGWLVELKRLKKMNWYSVFGSHFAVRFGPPSRFEMYAQEEFGLVIFLTLNSFVWYFCWLVEMIAAFVRKYEFRGLQIALTPSISMIWLPILQVNNSYICYFLCCEIRILSNLFSNQYQCNRLLFRRFKPSFNFWAARNS